MPSNGNTAHYVRSVCNELCRDVEGRQGGGCIYAVAVHHEVMTEFNPNPTHTHKHHFVSSSTWIWCHFHLLWCICIWLSETGRKNTAWCRCHTLQPARPHLEMVCLATHLLIQWFYFNAKTMKEHIWTYAVNKTEYALYFMFFKVATFCFGDSFAHSWYSVSQIHEVVTANIAIFLTKYISVSILKIL